MLCESMHTLFFAHYCFVRSTERVGISLVMDLLILFFVIIIIMTSNAIGRRECPS